jgi:hypothetical protein
MVGTEQPVYERTPLRRRGALTQLGSLNLVFFLTIPRRVSIIAALPSKAISDFPITDNREWRYNTYWAPEVSTGVLEILRSSIWRNHRQD